MKDFKMPLFLVVLMIMGSVPGIYAISVAPNDNNVSVGGVNVDPVGAKTIYVAKNGTDRNDGLTPERPKRNIEIALGVANPGDTIRVGPGTYYNNLQINKNITLIGDNQNNTIIDGQQAYPCIIIQSADGHIYTRSVAVTIINFTLKNGITPKNWGGGGIRNDGQSVTLENSTITNCASQSYGGGISTDFGTMTISRAIIENNSASTDGGGIYIEGGSLTIEDSNITNNTSRQCDNDLGTGGGIGNHGFLTIEDSTIKNNTAGLGGGIYNTGTLYVYGSTITTNWAPIGGGGILTAYFRGPVVYIDDLTIIHYNFPNDFEGPSFIPS
ncbi:hypothetical protein [Methanobacterium spitsbergense]|uniref:DUF1565 domain-containing protein n=1 Tax=Methanobacterium spitsbergense TaxID=2874285 RepID=A0A8T5UTT7_9EURY|nr:hypothetical protein [Methanobacterium spitsbergense]MBZ2167124.1 hypothetical protein [Methanobacterium spitsbergense]